MRVNADFSQPVVITPAQHKWVHSPQSGVERVMLDRIGAEKARATSLVRYAPDSFFPTHEHPGGEEILVLSGVFSEANRHHAAGSYLRNPPGSSHQPYTREGAVIFVKLMQMHAEDCAQVHVDTTKAELWQSHDNCKHCVLFENANERVELIELHPMAGLNTPAGFGHELLLLKGQLLVDGNVLPSGSWVRFPPTITLNAIADNCGATLYLKTGKLIGDGITGFEHE